MALRENSPGEEPHYLKPGEVCFLIPDQGRWEEHRHHNRSKTGASILVSKRDRLRVPAWPGREH
jgi:hypothetical protein